MSLVSGESVADSDQGSWVGESPERWEMKRALISALVVGVPQRVRAWVGETVREVGE